MLHSLIWDVETFLLLKSKHLTSPRLPKSNARRLKAETQQQHNHKTTRRGKTRIGTRHPQPTFSLIGNKMLDVPNYAPTCQLRNRTQMHNQAHFEVSKQGSASGTKPYYLSIW